MKVRGAGNAMAAAIADEFVRNGVTDAVFSPGSRSTPFVLAMDAHPSIRLHVSIDERSAAFLALGIAMSTGRPGVCLSTSGTAAANFYPAILEAHHARVPLIAVTADRPPELRDTGAGQAIDQTKMFGTAVRWFADPGVATGEGFSEGHYRSLACRAVAEATGSPKGAVHINLPFREPFSDEGPELDVRGRPGDAPWARVLRSERSSDEVASRLLTLIEGSVRGLIVVGSERVDPRSVEELGRALGWPVLAAAQSGCRSVSHSVAHYDAILRSDKFRLAHVPEVVLRVGSTTSSKVLSSFLDEVSEQIVIDRDARWLDPGRRLGVIVEADPSRVFSSIAKAVEVQADRSWADDWLRADELAEVAIVGVLGEDLSEPLAVREVAASVPPGTNLMVGSSMPVRDLDWFTGHRLELEVFSNRGVNGIDGFVSTAAGICVGGATFAVCGDLTFLHDVNGLLAARANDIQLKLLVLNNDGGTIFNFLPQANTGERFQRLFVTPHGLSIEKIASAYGCKYVKLETVADVRSFASSAPTAVEVAEIRTSHQENHELHNRVWEAVVQALGG